MARNYHLFNPGRLSRQDNTLVFENKAGVKKYLPVADVGALYVHGALDVNSALLHFLGRAGIPIYFFDYHEHFTGTYQPREYLQAGQVKTEQVRHYLDPELRIVLARKLVTGAGHNIRRALKYYAGRTLPELAPLVSSIENYLTTAETAPDIPTLMGLEGNIRQTYYAGFDHICPQMPLNGRNRRPPENEMNALISFGNSLCYSVCLSEIYHTQLDPTVSYLHEPGYRRFSLALDLSEIFKPLLVDRLIFQLVNKQTITSKDFEPESGGIILKEKARQTFVQAWEERMRTTIEHKKLKRPVSYRRLIRLEGYKLIKHVLGERPYQPFKANW